MIVLTMCLAPFLIAATYAVSAASCCSTVSGGGLDAALVNMAGNPVEQRLVTLRDGHVSIGTRDASALRFLMLEFMVACHGVCPFLSSGHLSEGG